MLADPKCAKKTFPAPLHHLHKPGVITQVSSTAQVLWLVLTAAFGFADRSRAWSALLLWWPICLKAQHAVHAEMLPCSPQLFTVIWVRVSRLVSLINKAFPFTELLLTNNHAMVIITEITFSFILMFEVNRTSSCWTRICRIICIALGVAKRSADKIITWMSRLLVKSLVIIVKIRMLGLFNALHVLLMVNFKLFFWLQTSEHDWVFAFSLLVSKRKAMFCPLWHSFYFFCYWNLLMISGWSLVGNVTHWHFGK